MQTLFTLPSLHFTTSQFFIFLRWTQSKSNFSTSLPNLHTSNLLHGVAAPSSLRLVAIILRLHWPHLLRSPTQSFNWSSTLRHSTTRWSSLLQLVFKSSLLFTASTGLQHFAASHCFNFATPQPTGLHCFNWSFRHLTDHLQPRIEIQCFQLNCDSTQINSKIT